MSNGLLPAALIDQWGDDAGRLRHRLHVRSLSGHQHQRRRQSESAGTRPGPCHTALGTAGLDIRQVFLTFGNKDMGTVMAGRNIGLFGADAILNDMTLLGVGAGNGSYAAPANTSLGSIGLGYIYTDWLSQIDYTTPDLMRRQGLDRYLRSLEYPEPDSGLEEGARHSGQGRVHGGPALSVGERPVPTAARYRSDGPRPGHEWQLQ